MADQLAGLRLYSQAKSGRRLNYVQQSIGGSGHEYFRKANQHLV